MNYTKEELSLIWLDSFLGLEYKYKEALYEELCLEGRIKENLIKIRAYIESNIGENIYNTLISSATDEYLEYLINGLEKRGIVAITKYSTNYPKSLQDLPLAPLVLYAKGNLELLNKRCFAIVGSRKSLPLQVSLAERFAKDLSNAGIVLVTGIAEGVDESVINASIETGNIISVIAGGMDKIYPAKNVGLFEKTYQKGLVISEHPPEIIPKPYLFPIRNRIIAGLADGVLIVSAGEKSGTLYTAEYAEEYSKHVFAFPYTPGISSGVGCNNLIKKGAYLTDSVQDIFDILKIEKKTNVASLSKEEEFVLNTIKEEEIHIEKLAEKTGMQIFELMPILSMLEIKKLVSKSMGNVYSAVGN